MTDQTPSTTQPTDAEIRMLWLPMALFVLISVADTVSSVYMLLAGVMEEYNPLMRWVWESGGIGVFCAVKVFLLVAPLWLFNKLKYERYWFIRRTLWITVFGYATIYCGLFVLANW